MPPSSTLHINVVVRKPGPGFTSGMRGDPDPSIKLDLEGLFDFFLLEVGIYQHFYQQRLASAFS